MNINNPNLQKFKKILLDIPIFYNSPILLAQFDFIVQKKRFLFSSFDLSSIILVNQYRHSPYLHLPKSTHLVTIFL